MSAFANGSGGSNAAGTGMASALATGMPSNIAGTVSSDPTAAQSGLGGSFNAGTGNVSNPASNNYMFQLPTAGNSGNVAGSVVGGTGTAPMAGLTGVGSGTGAATTMPGFANATTGSGNYNSPNGNINGAIAAGGKLSTALEQAGAAPKSGGTGRVVMRPQSFGAPVIAMPTASGSPQGNSLLQMMQAYRPGTIRSS